MTTYALICASDFAADDFLARKVAGEFDSIVAVDSGFAHLQALGASADVCLGDFDSLGFVPDGALVHPAIKDKSDLELSLDYALEQGATSIIVYGCLGGRLDHTLAALQNLAAVAEHGVRVRAIGAAAGDFAHANSRHAAFEVLEVLTGPVTLLLSAAEGAEPETVADLGAPTFGTISVFSAGDEALGVTEVGMYYPLNHAALTNRTSLGLSNEMIERECSISVESGTVYAIYPSSLTAHLA